MKAKLILTAMAMPVLFAACTSDELVSMEQQNQQVVRPMLSENFKLTVKSEVKGDVETRYTVTEDGGSLNFDWNAGDDFGAALIDAAQPGDSKPEDFDIIETSAGNSRFVYGENGVWTAETPLNGVGHYLFSFKYNAADKNRGPVTYTLPTTQKLYDEKTGELDLNAAIKNDNKAVGAALLEGEEGSIELRNLFAYPKFRVVFDNGTSVKRVEKVVLVHNDGGFITESGYNHDEVWNLFDPKKITKKIADEKYADEEEYWANVKSTEDFIIDGNDNHPWNGPDKTIVKKSNYIVAEFPGEDGIKLTSDAYNNNKYIDVRFMIPGVDSRSAYSGKLSMYIYADNGIYKITEVADKIDFKKTTKPEVKNKVFARNTSYTLKLDGNDATNVEFMKKGDYNVVSNIDEWNDLVAEYDNAENEGNTYEIHTVGATFELDGSADMPEYVTFKVGSNIKITGNQIVSNIEVGSGKVIDVAEGAELTVGINLTVGQINNEGSVICPAAAEAYEVAYIVNNKDGKLLVGSAKGSKVAAAVANVTINTLYNNGGEVENNGKLIIGKMTNNGTFNNNGEMEVAKEGSTTNIKDDAETTDKKEGFYNNGTLKAKGNLDNTGDFYQNGVVFNMKNSGGTAYINVKENNHFDVLNMIDITGAFDAVFNGGGTKTNVYYTLTDATTGKTIAALNQAGVTKLTIDGGKITGAKENTETSVLEETLSATIEEITENGATFEGSVVAGVAYGTYANALELNGQVTVKNFNLGAVQVLNGKLTVEGKVSAGVITMGSIVEGEKTTAALLVKDNASLKASNLVAYKEGSSIVTGNSVQNNGAIDLEINTTKGNSEEYDENSSVITDEYQAYLNSEFDWNGTDMANNGHKDTTEKTKYDDKKQIFMNGAVETWASKWSNNAVNFDEYYNKNPYDYYKFAEAVKYGETNQTTVWGDWWNLLTAGSNTAEIKINSTEVKALYGDKVTNFYAFGDKMFEMKDGKYVNDYTTYFENALKNSFTVVDRNDDEKVKETWETMALTKLYGSTTTKSTFVWGDMAYYIDKLYSNKDAAEAKFIEEITHQNNWGGWVTGADASTPASKESVLAAQLSAYVWYEAVTAGNDDLTAFDYYMAAHPCQYIWVDCDLDQVVDAIMTADKKEWTTLFNLTGDEADELFGNNVDDTYMTTMTYIKNWMAKAGNVTDASGNGATAKNIYTKYGQAVKAWTYTEKQIKACK